MKKKYLFITGAKRWNNLLSQFTKLQNKLQSSNSQNGNLVNKLKSIYSKLEKMQYQTGIKVAGTSLAIILSAFTANAQFSAGVPVDYTGAIYENGFSGSAFADIDGDGDDDLYLGNQIGNIEVYTNNNGVFTLSGLLQDGGFNLDIGTVASPVFADIDGDGDLDLYVGSNHGKVELFTNNNGVFTSSGYVQGGGIDIYVGSKSVPAFADLDGDNDLDLYVGTNSGNVESYINNNGVFGAPTNLGVAGTSIQTTTGGYAAPAFEDIDADGDLDIFLGTVNGTISTFTKSNGFFYSGGNLQSNLGVDIDHGAKSIPTFRDADNDGDLDLYVNTFMGNIFLYTNNGGVFTAAGTVQASGLSIDIGSVAAPTFADIDTDGDLDLYVGNSVGYIKVFNNNNGGFTETGDLQAGPTTISGFYTSSTFADIDGDGDLDLYVGDYDGSVKPYINNGGVFTGAPDIVPPPTIWSDYYAVPAFADIDNDGDLDLYVGKYYGEVEVFTNNNGIFTSAGDLQVNGANLDVGYNATPSFADIDNDGDLDLYVGNNGGEIEVFTNTNGVFAAGTNVQVGGTDIDVLHLSSPTFADIDGDGDLDLYVGNGTGEITFYENTNSAAVVLVSSITIQGAASANTITTAGGTLQMSATVLPANASNGSYSWSVANGTGSATIDANGLLTATTDGTVTVTATANDASGQTATMVVTISNQTAVVLVSSITIQGAASANTITTAGGTLQMSATVLPANADDGTYTWSVANGTGSATIDATGLLTATTDGTVTVTATANDASGQIATMVVTISNQTTGVNELSLQKVNIYPNPVQNELFIEIENQTINQLEVIDFSGRIVKSVFNNNVKSINVSELNQGMYILKIETENGSSVTRFVKQ
jgi:uncharacterized protein YjdB